MSTERIKRVIETVKDIAAEIVVDDWRQYDHADARQWNAPHDQDTLTILERLEWAIEDLESARWWLRFRDARSAPAAHARPGESRTR